MNYWRMQLHPNDASNAAAYTIESLAAHHIGLGFINTVGDLLADRNNEDFIITSQKDYKLFATEMQEDDRVLVIVHHFPFALVTVASEYNYSKEAIPELGVWFNHFRRVKDIKYYSDFKTNAHGWDKIIMTDTISILRDPKSKSYKLIEKMSKWNNP